MQAVGDYVSNMAGDFFNSDYLRQKVVKVGMKVNTENEIIDEKEEYQKDEIQIPRFKLRQQNYVSQFEIDKNTRFYMTRLRVATGFGGNSVDAVQRFDEFNRHLADFPFAKGKYTQVLYLISEDKNNLKESPVVYI